ncbi:hypothetical protein D3C75_756510 [compost metagenome]
MPHDPVRVCTYAFPAPGNLNHNTGMVLGDVIQIIRYTLAHVQRRIRLQLLQHREHRGWITLEHGQRLAPGEAGPAALAGQPPHMLVRMLRPDQHLRHHPLRVTQQKRPDGEFR